VVRVVACSLQVAKTLELEERERWRWRDDLLQRNLQVVTEKIKVQSGVSIDALKAKRHTHS
jgi:hypothetical protein